MNCAGCPAIEGIVGLEEFPPGPWHATHNCGSAAVEAPEKNKGGSAADTNAAAAAAPLRGLR